MIAGLFLRNIKTYKGINFIPLTHKDNFSGIIGRNGIGKSTILESLEYVFNDVDGDKWNCHYDSGKDSDAKPYVVPVLLIEKKRVCDENESLFEALSSFFWNVSDKDLNSANVENCRAFVKFRDELKNFYSPEVYYLIAVGKNKDNKYSATIFESSNTIGDGGSVSIAAALQLDANENREIQKQDKLGVIWSNIESLVDYIYIPKDIDPEKMTRLETSELQTVMGTTVQEIISSALSKKEISEISRKLKAAVQDISSKLEGYEYKEPGKERESMLKGEYLYNLIKNDFFSKRKLHKKTVVKSGEKSLLVSQLSSGEKQQAIVNIYYSLLVARNDDKEIIFAIDEPESSLHVSACYEQFEKLRNLCSERCQVLFTSHWYGFIPAISNCSIVNISKEELDEKHKIDVFYSDRYREQIAKQIEMSKRTEKKDLPLSIELKCINDFVQSVISSVLFEKPYNWILCEGASDKVYMEAYFSNEIEKFHLRIVPVGGVGQIKRLYKQFEVLVSEKSISSNMKGRILLLSDTDSQLDKYDVVKCSVLKSARLVSLDNSATVDIVDVDNNNVSPADVEDGVNGKLMYEILKELNESFPEKLSFMDFTKSSVDDKSSLYALDLKRNDLISLKNFYNDLDLKSGRKMKCIVADCYVEKLRSAAKGTYAEPAWISTIRKFMFNK